MNIWEKETVIRARELAEFAHKGQQRKSGEPYIVHPIAVAERLWDLYGDVDLVVAGLLHDAVEDNEKITVESVAEDFGDGVAFLVDALTKGRSGFMKYPEVVTETPVERLLWGLEKDIRVVLVKLADREHNMSTIDVMPSAKQVRISFETQAVYEPLKRIISWGNTNTVEQAEKSYAQWKKQVQVISIQEIKEALLSESFNNLSGELYKVLYNDTSSVIWSLDDWETYVHITENKELSSSVSFLSISGNQEWFHAIFQFKGAALLGQNKLGISSYSNILL